MRPTTVNIVIIYKFLQMFSLFFLFPRSPIENVETLTNLIKFIDNFDITKGTSDLCQRTY